MLPHLFSSWSKEIGSAGASYLPTYVPGKERTPAVCSNNRGSGTMKRLLAATILSLVTASLGLSQAKAGPIEDDLALAAGTRCVA
jgi:hypothetical protein